MSESLKSDGHHHLMSVQVRSMVTPLSVILKLPERSSFDGLHTTCFLQLQ